MHICAYVNVCICIDILQTTAKILESRSCNSGWLCIPVQLVPKILNSGEIGNITNKPDVMCGFDKKVWKIQFSFKNDLQCTLGKKMRGER